MKIANLRVERKEAAGPRAIEPDAYLTIRRELNPRLAAAPISVAIDVDADLEQVVGILKCSERRIDLSIDDDALDRRLVGRLSLRREDANLAQVGFLREVARLNSQRHVIDERPRV